MINQATRDRGLLKIGAVATLIAILALALMLRSQETPVFHSDVYGTNELVFRGCIHLPPLAGSVEQFCMVEDRKTHVRFVVDEIVSTQGGEAHSTVDGQGH